MQDSLTETLNTSQTTLQIAVKAPLTSKTKVFVLKKNTIQEAMC
jgi:hypothetical protein